MADYDEDDVIDGEIIYQRQDIPHANFRMKESINVDVDETISINSKYTSDGSTSNDKKIFDGRIENADYFDAQHIRAISKAEELDQIRPTGSYDDVHIECIIGDFVNTYCNYVSVAETSSSMTLYPDGDDTIVNWTDDSGGTSNLYRLLTPSFPAEYIKTSTINNAYKCTLDNHSLSSSYNYFIYKIKIEITAKDTVGDDLLVRVGVSGESVGEWISSLNTAFTGYEFEYDVTLNQSNINNYTLFIQYAGTGTCYVQNAKVHIYYKYYSTNLDKTTTAVNVSFGGEKTLKQILNWGCLQELKTWYLNPDLELLLNSADTDSGEDFIESDNISSIEGRRKIKSYDRVILYGGYVDGAQLTSDTAGGGTKIYVATYTNIINQTTLDNLATQILTEQGRNTYDINILREDSSKGLIQVGETIDISDSDITFSRSTKKIPAGTYIINKIVYSVADGSYVISDYSLIDALIISRQTRELPEENSQAISQIAGEISNDMARIKIIQYEGDGSNDREIDPGIDWEIRSIDIQDVATSSNNYGSLSFHWKNEDSYDHQLYLAIDNDYKRNRVWIDSTDNTLFHVSDGGGDHHPNKDGYEYLARIIGGGSFANIGTGNSV